MKQYLAGVLLFASGIFCNLAHAQSQDEMNRTSWADYQKADARLNATYKKLLAKLDDQGRKKLVAAERAWVAYRDAQADFDADAAARGGSMEPMEYNEACLELTEARIKELTKALAED